MDKPWENSVLAGGKIPRFHCSRCRPRVSCVCLPARAVSVLFGFVVVLFRPVRVATFGRRRGKIPRFHCGSCRVVVCVVFGLCLRCLRFLHLRLCVRRRLLVENVGTFHDFIAALAIAVVRCLCCVWRNTLVGGGLWWENSTILLRRLPLYPQYARAERVEPVNKNKVQCTFHISFTCSMQTSFFHLPFMLCV